MIDANIDIFNSTDRIEQPRLLAAVVETIANTAARKVLRRDRDRTVTAVDVEPILLDLPPNGGGDTEVILADVAVIKVDATEGAGTAYGLINEVPDGVITTFTNSTGFYEPGSVELYLNSQKQGKGVDYTESDNSLGQVDFTTAPLDTESIIWSYKVSEFEAKLIYATSALNNTNNKVKGVINGSNKVFTAPGPYKTGTLKAFIQGMIQTQGSDKDWTETDPAIGTFTFDVAPLSGEVVSTSHEPAGNSRRYENTNDTLTYAMLGSTRGDTSSAYAQNSLELSWNGQLLTPGTDFIETNPTTGEFNTITAITTGIIQAAYDVGINSVAVGERTLSQVKTGDYTLTIYDRSVNADATSTDITITLPAAGNTEGMEFNIIKIDSTANTVTIIGTVNGVTDPVIGMQYDSYTMRSNGAEYFLV